MYTSEETAPTGNPILSKLTSIPQNRLFTIILVGSVVLGIGAGFLMAGAGPQKLATSGNGGTPPKSAQADNRTFRDFAEGTIEKRKAPKNESDYVEGTHTLVRAGAVPVALTSSVVDLSEYEGKKVKVYGETQKAIKEGWLMDVGRVEEAQ